MDHEVAVHSRAAQRYLLEELSPEDRELFEAHYFDCQVCAADVVDTAAFVENARAVFRNEPRFSNERARSGPSLLQKLFGFHGVSAWAPVMATVLFALISGYQRFYTIPALQRAVVSTVLVAEARGERALVRVHPGDPQVSLTLEVSDATGVEFLHLSLLNSSGQSLLEQDCAYGPVISIRPPSSLLPDGAYEIVVRNGREASAPVLNRFQFRIERK